ncbi:class I adenylate-forming enzyme family protein [Nocardioides sp.]|uniref:class I adenylate-forming enzyme family protein n=1 Tax=Nocardioides sp. TaxID=35761 RepID=UPI002736DC84|nr:class I adenylate-forming enzyme family protein [Nocardioides sp.]MDP3891674.1 class I adenylate-forming enzyme family protein [Nocardioides sp.]
MAPLHDLSDLVAQAARESPSKLALVEADGRSLTWSTLEDEVARVATGLGSAGMVAGYRLLIAVGNRIEFVTSYVGALRAHVVAVPVNPRSTPGELARMIADSGSRMVVADPETVAPVREAVALVDRALAGDTDELGDLVDRAVSPRVVVIGAPLEAGEVSYDDLRAEPGRPIPPRHDPEGLAALLYTSGTSGRPRAAMLTHRALLANIDQVAAVEPPMIHGDDVVLAILPLFHVYGLNAVLGGCLRHRAKLLIVPGFDPEKSLDLIEDEACSVIPVAPPVIAHWLPVESLRERLGPVRLILSGSAPLAADVIDRFTAVSGLPVHQGYGLTEAAPVVTSTLCSPDAQHGSVGAALPGISVRLVDDAGSPVEGEDPGEIEVRGDNLFSGYWPDGSGGPDAEGWWRTGDVGLFDAAGDLTLVDRVKELVIVSGFNVYPAEVEDVISEVDGVEEAAVIGVDDAHTGEAVVAYVRGHGDPDELADAVRRHCAERLARFKQPTRIEMVDELPYTVTGKVQKGRLRGIERRRALDLVDGPS